MNINENLQYGNSYFQVCHWTSFSQCWCSVFLFIKRILVFVEFGTPRRVKVVDSLIFLELVQAIVAINTFVGQQFVLFCGTIHESPKLPSQQLPFIFIIIIRIFEQDIKLQIDKNYHENLLLLSMLVLKKFCSFVKEINQLKQLG